MGIPHPNDSGITTDEKRPTLLFPVGHDPTPGPSFHRDDIVQRSERADHLNRAVAEIGIIVAIQTNDSITCWELSLAGAYYR